MLVPMTMHTNHMSNPHHMQQQVQAKVRSFITLPIVQKYTTCTHIFTNAHGQMCTHAPHSHTHTHMHTRMHAHTHTHTYTHTHMHTCIPTSYWWVSTISVTCSSHRLSLPSESWSTSLGWPSPSDNQNQCHPLSQAWEEGGRVEEGRRGRMEGRSGRREE